MSSPENNTESKLEKDRLKKLVSSESLDELMQVVGSKIWIALICCFALILTTLIWSFAGSIPVKVTGSGIAMTEAGPQLVIAGLEGTIAETFVTAGQSVKKGDLIAKIDNSRLLLDIQLKRNQITQRENDLHALASRIEVERNAKEETLLKQKETALTAMEVAENSLPFLHKDLESKIRLEKKGILPPKTVEEAKTKIFQTEIEIENQKANLARIQEDLDRSYRVEEIQALQNEIAAAKGDMDRLLLDEKSLEVYSPYTGRILELIVATGDRVTVGAEIASIELPATRGMGLQYYATFPAQYGELLDVNLPVEIEVSGVDPKQYGFLLGKIKYLSPYPVTIEELKSDMRNSEIVSYLKGPNQIVYSAIIELQRDPSTKSGYKWSAEDGPPWEFSSGTTGTVKTIVERQPPIIYVLPLKFSPFFYRLITHE
jgi:HlyD family secretion protein